MSRNELFESSKTVMSRNAIYGCRIQGGIHANLSLVDQTLFWLPPK